MFFKSEPKTVVSKARLWSLALGLLLILSPGPAEAGKALPEAPYQEVVGDSRPLEIVPNLSEAFATGAGRSLWTHEVFIKDASFLKLHLVDVNLRAGDVLVLRSASGREVEKITGRGPKNWGTFWALSAFGESVTLELRFSHVYQQPPFRVDEAIVGRPGLMDPPVFPEGESICSPADFEDVMCYQGDAGKWANVFASAGVMTVGSNPSTGGLWCSASNVSPQNHVLTNQHCIENQSECDNAEFVFKYYRTSCGGGATNGDWQSFRCDEVVASSPFGGLCDPNLSNLDFALCTVMGDPASTFGFVEPDPNPITSGEDIYIVQHPSGRPHEIAHGGGPNVAVDGTTLRYYDTLDTEGGSSGSPIYRESDDKLIGLHHCGGCSTAGVGNRGMLMSDIYPLIENFLCTASASVSAAGVDLVEELSGNGDTVLEPGETWQFYPRLRNTACSASATAVTADIQVNAGSSMPVTLLDTQATFGDLAAGTAGASLLPVRFTVGPGASCGGNVILDLVNLSANGNAFGDALAVVSKPLGDTPVAQIMSEDFSGGMGSWAVTHNGTGTGPAATWTTDNPGGRSLSMTAPFAIVDSDELGSGQTMNEELVSPPVDATGYTTVELQYSHDFNHYTGSQNEQADVDVRSTATGGSWVNVANYSGGDASGTETVDITAQAAADLEVRFHYYDASFEWWWAVDNMALLGSNGPVCNVFAPGPGDTLFLEEFESGTLTPWDNTVGGPDLLINGDAALVNTMGLATVLNDTERVFVETFAPDGEARLRTRFYLDPNSIAMDNNKRHKMLSVFSDTGLETGRLLTLVFRKGNGIDADYWIRVKTRDNDRLWNRVDWTPLSDAPHFIELEWRQGAGNGQLRVWVDDLLAGRVGGIDNSEWVADRIRLGAIGGVDLGTIGSMYFDHVEVHRDAYVGPASAP